MNRFQILFTAICLATTATLADDRPNIVLVLTDDQGWSQLSASMDPEVPEAKSDYLETPAMARLVEKGMRFTSGYAPASLCTPTRRSILCGTSTARSGSEFRIDWVPAEHLTIPKALKQVDENYRCAHFGKWGEQMISTPEECGYDASDGETGNNTGGMPRVLIGPGARHSDDKPFFIDNEDPKKTKTVTDHSIAFMEKQSEAGHPFYVQASYYAQHLSVVATEKGIAKFEDKGTPDRGYTPAWAAMLKELDDGVGRLLDAISDLGIAQNTYFIFTADNGGRGTVPGGDESATPPNFPLTGAKHSLYEGGIRVPFIVVGPGIEPGSVCREPVVGYDFLPTFVDLAGGDVDKIVTPEVDGVSFAELLNNPDAGLQRPQGGIFFHRPNRLESAIRLNDHKLMVHWHAKGEVLSRELFAVGDNPREEGFEITEEKAEKADALQRRLLNYLEKVDAEAPRDFRKKKK